MRGATLERRVEARHLDTDRLRLRPHDMRDADAWHALASDARVIRYLSWPHRDAAAARRHLRDRTRHTTLWQTDDFLALAVTHRGQLVGDVSLQLRTVASDARAVEVGWLLSPEHQGKGFATEAVRGILHVAFKDVGARMVLAVVEDGNERSLALADRLGFTLLHRNGRSHLLVLTPDAFRRG